MNAIITIITLLGYADIAVLIAFAIWVVKDRTVRLEKGKWFAGVCKGVAFRWHYPLWLVRAVVLIFFSLAPFHTFVAYMLLTDALKHERDLK
jgi:phage shock protein PspC (stress-responsive transcriptional regulator)